jgi:hypothetical protein
MELSSDLVTLAHNAGYDLNDHGLYETSMPNQRFKYPSSSVLDGVVMVFRHRRTGQRMTHAKAQRLLDGVNRWKCQWPKCRKHCEQLAGPMDGPCI